MSTNTDTKSNSIVKSEVVRRIPHFCPPEQVGGEKVHKIQAVRSGGDMLTVKATRPVWEVVRGNREGNEGEKTDLGIRNYAACDYQLHYDGSGTVVAIDIIPSRYFVRGAAPITARNAIRKGFQLLWDEKMNGFELKNENLSDRDLEASESFRVGYVGMTQKTLLGLLEKMRELKVVASRKKSHVVNNHKISLLEDGVFKVVPQAAALAKVSRLQS